MAASPPKDVTTLLEAVRAGEPNAMNQLIDRVYQEFRVIAASLMKQESAGHTLQPTELAHEAFLRLIDRNILSKPLNRALFFAATAQAMRQILVDHARRRAAAKRGGAWQRVPLDAVLDAFETQQVDVLAIHEALNELTRLNERQSRAIELTVFGGHTVAEVAGLLQVSVSTVESDLRKARAFLYGRLGQGI